MNEYSLSGQRLVANRQRLTANGQRLTAELHCHSYFSLLDGASAPEALVAEAARLGISALALTDHHSLAGAVRFWVAARQAGIHPILGAEVALGGDGGGHLTLLAETQEGYANLCQLLTAAHLQEDESDGWPGKRPPFLDWESLARHHQGLLILTGCRQGVVADPLLRGKPEAAAAAAGQLLDIFGRDRLWLELQHHHLPEDDWLVRGLLALSRRLRLPTVATGNVHYATQEYSRLRDCLIAISHNQTLTEARRAGHLPFNSSYHLSSPQAVAERFHEHPEAVLATVEIASRCQASLDFADRRLPHFTATGGLSEFEYLYRLCHQNFTWRYPHLSPQVLKQLAHELDVIERAGLAGYFLIVWDIVRFAREQGIRCQGRGSAANSLVAYLLGITSIDPLQHNLLFERFLSDDNHTMPDIDLDFAADRREEVIQYVYHQYGREYTAMVCNVVTYQARSALRDIAKTLNFPPPVIDRLAKSLDTHSCQEAAAQLLGQVDGLPQTTDDRQPTIDDGRKTTDDRLLTTDNRLLTTDDRPQTADDGQQTTDDPNHPVTLSPCHPVTLSPLHPLHLLATLLTQIDGCPRHLSIHTGGMLITALPITQVVPLERATMPGRIVCQWDKESVEDAGLVKIDLLGLRTLGMISEALQWITYQGTDLPDLDALPLDDPNIYHALQLGDTIGVFQVESRAQQQMLPRLKPQRFEDIIVEVAIVRPGPIQGGAVHPYLRRRAGQEAVSYAHPSLEPVLQETLGVLLFQEQAIRVAVAAAGFSPSQADQLRRAMSRSRSAEAMAEMQRLFLTRAQANGLDEETARAIFGQLEGFAGFGFCKSHAASFAFIAYQTLYLKRYHPAAFYCALLNQQPMGFYSPEVIIGDARRHGVDLLPPQINRSEWKYTLEQTAKGNWALHMGLHTVDGLGEAAWSRIAAARSEAPFANLDDFCRRTRLPQGLVETLIRAGVLDDFGERRDLLWAVGNLHLSDGELALALPELPVQLPTLNALEAGAWEYEVLGLSPAGQIMVHYREALRKAGILSIWQVKQRRAGERVRVGGMVVVRQRPPTAGGVTFLSLEDESGLLDVVLQPPVYARVKATLRSAGLITVEGVVQREGRAVSLLAVQVTGLLS
jgi:error-prone DNA polymerase